MAVSLDGLKAKFGGKFTKEKISAGLDIGTAATKLIKLKFTNGAPQLCAFNIEPTPGDVAGLLEKYAGSHLQDVKRVNVSVSGPSSIIRYVPFPKMKKEELKAALKFEAEKHIPFAIGEVFLDGCILKEDLPDNKMLVLLAAVKKDALNQRLKSVNEAGFKAAVVDNDSLALINAFNFNYGSDPNIKAKTVALLNIGSSFSNLNILESGIPRFTRDFQFGSHNFTQKIADVLSVDFKGAESFKCNPDQVRLEKVKPAIEAMLSNLANEVRLSFDFYESQSTATVAKLFLSGAGSLFVGLKDMLGGLMGSEIAYWDPLKAIPLSNGLDPEKLKPVLPQLAVAVGLALRSQ
ncbi:MAG TPA: type IV pilus assembly protein PilM [Patescibacteria group bacterium]|nr:type IV pilus assembly protein PilM [Patescibacteria group bacterium]